MKKSWKNNSPLSTLRIVAAMLFVLLGMTGCSRKEESPHKTYTCPMHPTVISDQPGSCPVCGMALVPQARPGEEIKITESLSALAKSPDEVVVSSVETVRGQYRSLPITLDATGVVAYDPRNNYSISARVGGRLEKLYLNYEYQPVRKGQTVAEVYSPELLTAQRELFFLLEHDGGDSSLIRSAKSKLELLGLTAFQVNQLVSSRQIKTTFAIHSPYNGYLVGATDNDDSSPLFREGDYVSAGQTLFKLVNTSDLRVELDLPGANAAAVDLGDTVTLRFGENEKRMASVDFVQPYYNENANFIKIRVYVRQTDGLRIGQLVKATIHVGRRESLWVPRSAVLDLGAQQVIFIKERAVLKPKEVVTGMRSGKLIEITKGLVSSDEIAVNAHFLVDSESLIKPLN